MKVIILAAGQGTRLKPLTDSAPKCMVEVGGRPILQWQILAVKMAGLKDIAVVKGYMGGKITYKDLMYFTNEAYDSTNMVETLWCAEPAFGDGFIVSYGDIIYEPDVLRRLIESDHPVSVVTDSDWNSYWSLRFDDVLEDAETLMIDDKGQITEIGQKPEHLDQINGQYIGLTAFRGKGVEILREVYNEAKQASEKGVYPLRGQRSFEKLYMTDILQGIIDCGFPVHQVPVNGGWLEIDSLSDLDLARTLFKAVDSERFTIRRDGSLRRLSSKRGLRPR